MILHKVLNYVKLCVCVVQTFYHFCSMFLRHQERFKTNVSQNRTLFGLQYLILLFAIPRRGTFKSEKKSRFMNIVNNNNNNKMCSPFDSEAALKKREDCMGHKPSPPTEHVITIL